MKKTNTLKKLTALLLSLLLLGSVMAVPVSAAAAPAAPSTVTTAQNATAIKLTWSKVAGATGYRIYYKLPGDISWRTGLKSTTKTTHTFTGLSTGQSYRFAVRSYVQDSTGTVLGGYKEIAAATATPAPAKVTATQNTSAIKLTWSKVTGATGYKLYYKTSASASWKTALEETPLTSHTFKNIASGKKYIFAVRSFSASPFGTFYGGYKEIETSTKPATPTAKASSTASSITLSWNKVNATGYRIYYKSGSSSWKTAVSTTSKTTHTFSNLPANKAYTFAVRPYVKTASGVIWGGYKELKASTGVSIKIPSSKAEVASTYNTLINNLKAYKGTVTVDKTNVINFAIHDLPSISASIINPVVENLTKTEPTRRTFKNGVTAEGRTLNDEVIPRGRNATVSASAISGASVTTRSDGSFVMDLTLVPETARFNGYSSTNPVHHMSALDPLDFAGLDLGPVTISYAESYYPGATIRIIVDAKGRVVSLASNLPLEVNATGKAGINLTIRMEGAITTFYKFTYV